MATATAHFDLTKAGSNENYNVGLVNSNLDKIDQQMYLNQTSAAKVMVGATPNADGESGRVPQPNAGDEDKYLKADGTWDTPSGGGGGSSTLAGLTDVDLSSPTNGQILKYNSTTQKWENADEGGSSQRTYLGQLIPRVSASDSKITASTSNSSYAAWGAFNGTSPSNLSSPDTNSCWLPEANLTDQWIIYHFDAPRYFTKIGIVCFSNYSSSWVGDIKVEGSTDGSTWANILASGMTYELTAELQTSTVVEIDLDDTDLWEYIRVTFIDEMSVAYQPSCFIDEIYVYGGEEISGGSSAEEMTLDEYNALTTDEKNDGTIRFIPNGSTISATTTIDMSSISSQMESSMNVSSTSDQIVISWSGGNMIGGTFYYATPIDVTSWDKISFDLATSSCYGGGSSAQQARWNVQIGLQASAPSSVQVIDATDSRWMAVVDYANANTVYSNQELDVSELTGQYYLVINAHGWNAIIDDFVLEKIGVTYPSQIRYMDKTYGIGSSGGSHTYSTTEQKVGTWIDGSDVWEKTINIEETTIHGNTSFTIDIETNIDILIEYSLMYRDIALQNGRWNPLDNVTEQIGYDMYRNRLYLESNGTLKGDFAGNSGVVTICGVIRYTKVSAS